MYRKNDICELDVVSVTNLGYGVGKNGDNPVVFVPGTVTGERIEAVIIKVCRDYCIGRLKRVIMTSELKENCQVCHAPASCGGCPYRYLKYDEELRIKRENVVAEFRKAGIGDITVCPVEYVKDVQGNPVIYGYRNKAQYRFVKTKNGISAGFYASGTHRVTGDADCPLQPGIFAGITSFICEYAEKHGLSVYDETTGKGTLRHLYIRGSADKKSICVCLVINAHGLECSADLGKKLTDRFPQITGFVINENLSDSNLILGDKYDVIIGADGITDVFCGKIFDVRMAAFYQVNHDAAELLCGIARDLVSRGSACRGNSVFLDLYCGIGTIGLSAALPSQKLIGVEIVPEAVECAKRNAVRNGVCNAEFICADSFEGAADYLRTLTAGDIVCVDPPRKGCTEELLRAVDRSGARNMLYISCNPATLARDCAVMKSLGWSLSDAHPVDLFPRTGHVETVVLMSRDKE